MPKLKAILDDLSQVPEALKELYEKDTATGKFILSAEVDEHPSVRNLKTAHERVKQEKNTLSEEFKAKFAGIEDPELARKLLDEHQKQMDKKLIDAGEVDKLVDQKVEQRVKKMQEEHKKVVEDLNSQLSKSNSKLEELLITSEVHSAATAAGVRSTALDDVRLRAKQTFRVKDGSALPFDGEAIIYGKDGKTPLTIQDWVADLSAKAPHLFVEPTGAGARPGSPAGQGRILSAFRISREDAKDTTKYRQAKAEAEKLGVSVEIVD